MKAELILRRRLSFGNEAFAEMVIWKVPRPLVGSLHSFKYRLAYVEHGICIIRFDNESGKGDHVHIGERERPYDFFSMEKLVADFQEAVLGWRGQPRHRHDGRGHL
jgi:hypothetical protein